MLVANWLHRCHLILGHDFCPWANRFVYWLKSPLWCLVLAVGASAACGYAVHTGLFWLTGILSALLLLGIVWPWAAVRAVRGSVWLGNQRAHVGDSALLEVRLWNRWVIPIWGVVVHLDGPTAATPLAASIGCVLPRTRPEYTWRVTPTARGVYPTSGAWISTSFPFGLFEARRRLEVEGQFIVWPETVNLRGLPDAVEFEPHEERFAERLVGDSGDLLGTRGFREGDSLRRVHWAQTARQGRLIVCERQAPVACTVKLQVDDTVRDHDALEQVLRVAASIATSLARQHASVEARIGSDRLTIGPSEGDLSRFLDALARVPVGGRATSEGCPFHSANHSAVEVIVTSLDAFERHLTHAHSRSLRRFLVVSSSDAEHDPACCHPWLEVSSDKSRLGELAAAWRKACHATC